MITVNFSFGRNSLITGFDISGHSGYAEQGSDIICASVSSSAIMTANTVTEVLGLSPEIKENDGSLFLKLDEADAERSEDILKGFLLHMEELSKVYPEFIKIERGA